MVTSTGVAKGAAPESDLFDPDRLAYLEVAGWKAYYAHRWLPAFVLMIRLCREQFGLSWLRSLQGAYYITRSLVAWAPVDHDPRLVRRYIRKFYRLGAKHGKGLSYDPDRVTNLEFRYWDVHRKLSGRPDNEKLPLIRSLAELHSALFGIALEDSWESAVSRAHSTDTVDMITSMRSTDIQGDWRKAEEYLTDAYRSARSRMR